MPELPEVETVRRGLAPAMEGRLIERVEQRRPNLRWPFPEKFVERLTGARIGVLGRRAKYLLVPLEGKAVDETLIVHLGMSGRFLVDGAKGVDFVHETPADRGDCKHDHVVIHLEGGARAVFNDARRFGAMDLSETANLDGHKMLAGIGPEPLSNAFNADHLQRAFEGRKASLKSMLLDQTRVAGLGNIYVCEALFRSGLSPFRAAGSLTEPERDVLVSTIRTVLEEAIEAGGSSLRDYRQADGALGYFQHTFTVYGREGEPCIACGEEILRSVQNARSTFYCASCQK